MKIDRLQQFLGYQFKQVQLLEQALTHRSHSATHNERLEFLGDSILNFTIADLLFKNYTHEAEGDLSRIRASLVNQTTLAELAVQLSLSDHLRLGEGELKSGGFRRPSILADAMEAIFAAIYLDADMPTAMQVITSLYQPLVDNIDFKTAGKDSKTRLQELLQGHHLKLPQYTVIETRGLAHNQEFVVSCLVEDLEVVTEASGHSRRHAEQNAALAALDKVQSLIARYARPKGKLKIRKTTQLSLPVAVDQYASALRDEGTLMGEDNMKDGLDS